MSFKGFDVYSGLVGFFFSLVLLLALGSCGHSSLDWGLGLSLSCFSWVRLDLVSFYLGVLSMFLWLSLVFFSGCLSSLGWFFMSVSVFFSLLSYCVVHALGFWVCYEFSILPLLLLLILESPYSERYIASWYLLGYVVLTSLPMLLCFFYISFSLGSFNLMFWSSSSLGLGVFLVLGVMFITKIPLPPFHVWLPIVHAEATSPVSVCLSGYIMKLGILGVVRFCSRFLPDYIFSSGYILIGLCLSVLFFFSALRELDGKRWLAFLSLSHILIAGVCLCVCSFDGGILSLVYCLGHGFSAGVMFILFWVVYEVSGTRKWAILKSAFGNSLLLRCLGGACLCTAASLPPTVQFFCEVFILSDSVFLSLSFFFLLSIYLFFGGLVPMFFLGSVLTRHCSISYGSGLVNSGWSSMFFLVVWSFMLFLLS